jgi:hypothetical protein
MAVIMNCALLAAGHDNAVTQSAGVTSRPSLAVDMSTYRLAYVQLSHFTE